ncbi:protein ADM2 [Tenrec ecaudatus]|uniref:protein ADM2 n=1 Tax=Tenrec ecaudatus TaxID=94439 RepID=UPI003F599F83
MVSLQASTLFCISLLFLQLQGLLSLESWLPGKPSKSLAGIPSSDQLEQRLMPQTWIPKWHQAPQPQESYRLDRTLDQPLKKGHRLQPGPLEPYRQWPGPSHPRSRRRRTWLQRNACELPTCQTDNLAYRLWKLQHGDKVNITDLNNFG